MCFAFRMMVLVGTGVLALVVSPAFAQPVPLLRWTFDEADSGDTDAIDSGAAPAEAGVFMGGATRTSNTPGGASTGAADLLVVEDGYIQASDATALEGLSQLTITTWVNFQADPGGFDRLAALQGENPWPGFTFNVNTPNDGDLTADDFRLGIFIGGVDAFDFHQSTADIEGFGGEWVFVSTTYATDSADKIISFYVGDENNSVAQLGDPKTVFSGDIANAGVNFYTGKTDASTSNTSPDGFIDDLRIYGSALTLEELEVVRLENLPQGDFEADFDEDGDVDGDDFLLWQDGFGANITSGATKMDGDWDNDGDVDGDDFLGWQAEFPSPGEGSGSSAVPEPGSGLLALALCWLAFLSNGMHRRSAS